LKTGKSHKNRKLQPLGKIFLISLCLILPFCKSSASAEPGIQPLENEILTSLAKQIHCKKLEVQLRPSREKPGEIRMLAVKLEGVILGNMTADYMTVVYENPVIDLPYLRKFKKFKILSSSREKVSILISAKAFEDYLAGQARQLQMKNYRMSLRLSPPYMECLFNVPVSGLSSKSQAALDEFGKQTGFVQIKSLMKAGRFEGYAALQMTAKNNALLALPAKVIVNHFGAPGAVMQEAQTRVNPIYRVPVLAPFQYSIHKAAVQSNYLFLSN